jgi:hypothetical protein
MRSGEKKIRLQKKKTSKKTKLNKKDIEKENLS